VGSLLFKSPYAGGGALLLSMHRAQFIKHQRLSRLQTRDAVVQPPHHGGHDIHIVAQHADIGLHASHLFGKEIQGNWIIGHFAPAYAAGAAWSGAAPSSADWALATIAANASGSRIARSDNTLRSISTPASFTPCMNCE
jgi:hypothetical protein